MLKVIFQLQDNGNLLATNHVIASDLSTPQSQTDLDTANLTHLLGIELPFSSKQPPDTLYMVWLER